MISIPSSSYNTTYLPKEVLERYKFHSSKVNEKYSYNNFTQKFMQYSSIIKKEIQKFEEKKKNFDNLQNYIDNQEPLNPRLKILITNGANKVFNLECINKDEEDYFSDIDSLNDIIKVKQVKYSTSINKKSKRILSKPIKAMSIYKDIVLTANTTIGDSNKTPNKNHLLSTEEFYKKIKMSSNNSMNSTLSRSKIFNHTVNNEEKRKKKILEIQTDQENNKEKDNSKRSIEPMTEDIKTYDNINTKKKRIIFPSIYQPHTTTAKDNRSFINMNTPAINIISKQHKIKKIKLRALLNTSKERSIDKVIKTGM